MSCYEGRGGEGIKLNRVKVFICEEGREREREKEYVEKIHASKVEC